MFGDTGVFVFIIAAAALYLANRSRKDIRNLQDRIAELEKARLTPAVAAPLETTSPDIAPDADAHETPASEQPSQTADQTPPLGEVKDEQPAVTAEAPAKPAITIEERLGTRWVVWLGGLTLALGGFFMVRYSIEAGLLSPWIRCMLGALFAAALLAAGEYARRSDSLKNISPVPIANVPAILTAAGTSTAFATVYASYALYDLFAPATAFVMLGIVAMSTLAAALLHGPALGGLGLAAAFVTPVLVSSAKPDFWSLYIYLAVVTGAAFALARIRLWRWLAATTMVFALLWIAPGIHLAPTSPGPLLFHVIAGFTLAALLVICGFLFGPAAERDRVEAVSSIAPAVYCFGALLIALLARHTDPTLITFALLIFATLAIAWRAPAATGAVAAAAAFTALLFINWALTPEVATLVMPGGAIPGIGADPVREAASMHLSVAALFAIAFGITGVLAQGRFAHASVPIIWAASGTFMPITLLIATYARIAKFDASIPFAVLAVIVAAALAWATERLDKRPARPGLTAATALYATGAFASLSLALTFALEKGWLTISLSLTALGAIWIYTKRPIAFLRWLAAILAAIVIARSIYAPTIVDDISSAPPILNWLLWGYGVPALSFWTASVWMRQRGDDVPLRFVEAAAILFTVLLVILQIRHLATNGDMAEFNSSLLEIALQVCAVLAMAIGLERLHERSKSIVHNIAALLLGSYALLAIVFGLMMFEMPMFWHVNVGGLVFNLLLLSYAIPAMLALTLANITHGKRRKFYVRILSALSLILAMTYLLLQVRRIFQGPYLDGSDPGPSELYTYSIVWLIFGVALLAYGIFANSQRARLASSIVIGITVLKVFLIDMDALEGIYRALSFMCLGAVLVAIGWFYQRILFSRHPAPPVETTDISPQ